MNNQRKINSIVRAINIIKLLDQGVNSFTDIVNALDMKKSTVHGLIKTLEYEGFVTQNPVDRCYYLGPSLIRLESNPYNMHRNLINIARGKMELLQKYTGETVVLVILLGTYVFTLEVIQSKEDIVYVVERGTSIPAYVGPAARTLLSQLNKKDMDNIIDYLNFVPFTPATVMDKNVIKKQVRYAKKNGYFITSCEKSVGSLGISVPIKNYICPAALTVLGPEYRLRPKSNEVIQESKRIANQISNDLKEHQ